MAATDQVAFTVLTPDRQRARCCPAWFKLYKYLIWLCLRPSLLRSATVHLPMMLGARGRRPAPSFTRFGHTSATPFVTAQVFQGLETCGVVKRCAVVQTVARNERKLCAHLGAVL